MQFFIRDSFTGMAGNRSSQPRSASEGIGLLDRNRKPSNTFAALASLIIGLWPCYSNAGEPYSNMKPAFVGPEYMREFEAVVLGATPREAPLERQTLTAQFRAKLLGYAGSEQYFQAQGEHSPVRFEAKQPVEFVIKGHINGRDPNQVFQIAKLNVRSGIRILPFIKSNSIFVGGASGEEIITLIPFVGSPVGENFYRVVPTIALTPGEYLVRVTNSPDVYLFGID